MWSHPHLRPARFTALAAILVLTLALAPVLSRPAAVRADDGCDPSEPVACVPLPDESDGGPGSDRGAIGPAVAAPAPIRPDLCPPILSDAPPGAAIAAPLPAPRGCSVREIVVAVNRANVLYARALRTLDVSVLFPAWGGEALADLRAQIAGLRATGRFVTPQLLSITPREIRPAGRAATVRTIENWIYQERARFTGELLFEQNQWVQNIYSLAFDGGSWLVMRDVITLIDPPPLPSPVVSAAVVTDRDIYPANDTVRVTVTNDGSVTLTAGGGFRCSLFRIERLGPDGWQRAPFPEPLIACPAIATLIRPGESRTEFLPAGGPGIYRIAFPYSAETGETGTAFSAPYVVR